MKSLAGFLIATGGTVVVYSMIGISFLSYRQKGAIYNDQAKLVAKLIFWGIVIGGVGIFILTNGG